MNNCSQEIKESSNQKIAQHCFCSSNSEQEAGKEGTSSKSCPCCSAAKSGTSCQHASLMLLMHSQRASTAEPDVTPAPGMFIYNRFLCVSLTKREDSYLPFT